LKSGCRSPGSIGQFSSQKLAFGTDFDPRLWNGLGFVIDD